ncbi:hypothetical protein BCR44DRAFT_1483602 [Catenaria anguillulae PL171]|uniref:non-specific serine/threonine protein kinase n=1 Tax=Catenaria anguillulae PL171 TaxID=765915 RepID=A0A1Y2HTI7_9FUNG|nr:hypothetical protein BCR44DRAFT_1483602 [Catenaria anguillulae PL171]
MSSTPSSPSKSRLSNEYRIGDFKLGKTIGQGAFSKVKLGFHKETGQKITKSAKRKEKMKHDAAKKKAAKENHAAATAAAATATNSGSGSGSNGAVPKQPESPRDRASSAEPQSDTSEATAASGATKPPSAPVPVTRGDSIPVISPISSPLPPKDGAKTLMDSLYAEVKLLMRLNHPNIIGLYQVIDSDDECFIIMEYAPGGELIDYIAAKDYLSEKEARRFFRQIMSAIDHCHQASVVHRDLKLENLLLSASRDILITDFGLGRTFRSDIEDLMMTFCGTPNYAAVELISFKPYIGVHTDVWAMGVILFIMCSGKPPFHGHSIPSLYNKIMNLQYTCPDHFTPELRQLLARILVKDPAQRITMAEMYEDRWVNFEEIERPLKIQPLYDTLRDTGMDQILSINKDAQSTVFSFARYQTDILSHVVVAGVNPSTGSRRGSINPPGEDSEGGIGSGATLGRRMSLTVARRMSLRPASAGPGQPPMATIDMTKPGQTAAGVPGRRMSLVAGSTSPTRHLAPLNAINEANNAGGSRSMTPAPGSSAAGTNSGGISASRSMDFRRNRRMSFHSTTESQSTSPPLPNAYGNPSVEAGSGFATPNQSSGQSTASFWRLYRQCGQRHVAGSVNHFHGHMGLGSASVGSTPTKGNSRRLSLVTKGDSILYNLQQPLVPGPNGGLATCDGTTAGLVGGTGAVAMDLEPEKLAKPSSQAIADWHMIHRPPKSIRAIRFSLTSTNTSSMPPSAVFQELHRGLLVLATQYPGLTFARDDSYYMFNVSVPMRGGAISESASNTSPRQQSDGMSASEISSATSPTQAAAELSGARPPSSLQPAEHIVRFEVEVCKVWLLNLHGVRFKRISGDSLAFKELYKELTSRLVL